MKLIGKLKEKVEKTSSLSEAKEEIAKAGMELTDEEMGKVAGGAVDPCDTEEYRDAWREALYLLQQYDNAKTTAEKDRIWNEIETGSAYGYRYMDIFNRWGFPE